MSWFTSFGTFAGSLSVVTAISSFAIPVIVAASYYLWARKHIAPLLFILLTTLVAASTAMQQSVFLGQTSPLILGLIIAGLACAVRWPYLAGVLIGSAAAVKLTPLAVIAPLLLRRDTRRSGITSAVVAAFVLLGSFLFTSRDITRDWMDTISELSSYALPHPGNQSLVSYVYRADSVGWAMIPLNNEIDSTVQTFVSIFVLLVVAGSCLVAWLLPRYGLAISATLILCVPAVMSGIYWSHYSLLFVPLIMGTFTLARREPVLLWLQGLTVLLFFPPASESVFGSGFALPFHYSILLGSIISIVLFVIAVALWLNKHSTQPPRANSGQKEIHYRTNANQLLGQHRVVVD